MKSETMQDAFNGRCKRQKGLKATKWQAWMAKYSRDKIIRNSQQATHSTRNKAETKAYDAGGEGERKPTTVWPLTRHEPSVCTAPPPLFAFLSFSLILSLHCYPSLPPFSLLLFYLLHFFSFFYVSCVSLCMHSSSFIISLPLFHLFFGFSRIPRSFNLHSCLVTTPLHLFALSFPLCSYSFILFNLIPLHSLLSFLSLHSLCLHVTLLSLLFPIFA